MPKARARAKKSKMGCRTCKYARLFFRPFYSKTDTHRIRRVKCDEGRPACQRCVSTGRVCDGYGIWGGGGNGYGTAERTLNSISMSKPPRLTSRRPGVIPCLSQPEWDAFHFFRTMTVLKLPGVFGSDFWEKLVFQISFREPAVLHAVIALAALHRRGVTPGQLRRPITAVDHTGAAAMDANERLALQQYNKAIRHLRPHLENQGSESVRITLASCVIFTCIELLKGDNDTSRAHLKSGLKLLQQIYSTASSETDWTDDNLSEAFTRIYIQPSLFCQGSEFGDMAIPTGRNRPRSPVPLIFNSLVEARRHLDWLLHDTNQLSGEVNSLGLSNGKPIPESFIHRREMLQRTSSAWLRAFSASINSHSHSHSHIPSRTYANTHTHACPPLGSDSAISFGAPLLLLYHKMAHVMIATSLRRDDETVFDDFTGDFAHMLQSCVDLWERVAKAMQKNSGIHHIRSDHSGGGSGSSRSKNILSFTADMGFIPPLYWLALKCRVPRFRRYAAHLIRKAPHREGMWDGVMAAAVANKVMHLEEGEFYNDDGKKTWMKDLDVEVGTNAPPEKFKILMDDDVVLIPRENRISHVSVVLSEETASSRAVLLCKRWDGASGDWDTETVELDMTL